MLRYSRRGSSGDDLINSCERLYLGTPQFGGMQRYVARSAKNVIAGGVHPRNPESRKKYSKKHQSAASPRKIPVSGKAYKPLVRKIDIVKAVKTISANAVVAGVADPGERRPDPTPRNICSASAAQIARTK